MRPHIRILVTFVLLICPVASFAADLPAHPARYLVFELDESQVPRVMSHQLVQLSSPLLSRGDVGTKAVEPGGRYDAETIVVRLLDESGAEVFTDRVRVPQFFHGEHGLHGEWSETELYPAQRAFVVRVPRLEGSRLLLEGGGRAASAAPKEFDLDTLELDARLPLAQFQPRLLAEPAAAGVANRVDLLLIGEGYTADQQNRFEADVSNLLSGFFGRTPYREYRDFVAVSTLFVASSQSGADHPPFDASCSASFFQSCCADTRMQQDPLAGTFVSTAFDSSFCAFNSHRSLVANLSKVLTAAAAAPGWDRILLLVNDSTYGGTGGAQMGVFSVNASVIDLAQHEYGHTFSDLADEYTTPYPLFPSCSDFGGDPCEANVTDQTSRDNIKWRNRIAASTPLPTPGTDPNVVGLFEGARYLSTGMYRPQHACLMNTLRTEFCQVCTEAYVRRLYEGWNEGEAGIDPIESTSPSPGTFGLALPGSRSFSVGLLQPQGNTVRAAWFVDGTFRANGSNFTFSPQQAGSYQIRVEVRDESPLLSSPLASRSREWLVNVTGRIEVIPTVTAVSPDSGPTAGGTTVTITGTGFAAGASVRFGGAAATEVVVESATRITAKTPPGSEGPVDVVVTTSDGSGTKTGAYTYGSTETCVPTATRMCLGEGRFRIETNWRTAAPATGAGNVTSIPGSSDSGLFWFFSQNNQEMLIKVLNGCDFNNHYWVFFAATTNVEFKTTITDTRTGRVKVYSNNLGQPAAPVQDIEAFATCP